MAGKIHCHNRFAVLAIPEEQEPVEIKYSISQLLAFQNCANPNEPIIRNLIQKFPDIAIPEKIVRTANRTISGASSSGTKNEKKVVWIKKK